MPGSTTSPVSPGLLIGLATTTSKSTASLPPGFTVTPMGVRSVNSSPIVVVFFDTVTRGVASPTCPPTPAPSANALDDIAAAASPTPRLHATFIHLLWVTALPRDMARLLGFRCKGFGASNGGQMLEGLAPARVPRGHGHRR